MNSKVVVRLAVIRFLLLLVVSIALVWIGSEAAYLLQKDVGDRAPKVVQLVIPPGTAEKVAVGEPVPSIPEEMSFVVGDVLVVKNEDETEHQLGPLWVPANSSASLALDEVNNFAYQCSFQTTRYLGLNVRPPTTFLTRLQAVFLAAPATAAFLFVYSLLVFPLQPKKEAGKNSVPAS
jgi:hypothetical protein